MPVAQQVAVPAGVVPQLPASAPGAVQHSREINGGAPNIPPAVHSMQPGFMPPAPAPAAQPAAAPAPETGAPAAVDPVIATLLAALAGQQATAAAPAAPAPAPQTPQGLLATTAPATSDQFLASVNGILANAGVDVQRALANAIEYGDANLIDNHYLDAVGGANAAQLKALAVQAVQHAAREEAAQAQVAYAIAGGEQNLRAAVGTFNQSAPPHIQTLVQTMMDSKNRQQIEAGTRLIVEFAKGNGGLMQPAGLVGTTAAPAHQAALSKDAFQEALYKLDRNSRTYEQQRGELFGRRALGKSQGM